MLRLYVKFVCVKLLSVKFVYVKFVCVKLLYVKFVLFVCVVTEAAGGGGGGEGAGYRIKNKNPTQRCGEKDIFFLGIQKGR